MTSIGRKGLLALGALVFALTDCGRASRSTTGARRMQLRSAPVEERLRRRGASSRRRPAG